jgi:acetylornithine deacetylase/succinyl-diaminopimelate desuccinylase-like protein
LYDGYVRLVFSIFLFVPLSAQPELAREIFKQLIEINTTDSVGDNTRAANAMADRFRAAGFPDQDIQVLAPVPRKGNLVFRWRGTGAGRPVLFLGHLDVVEALRSDWSFDPFQFREQDGFFYGRGTQDMKADDATLVAAFLRLKREGFQPARDLILALTADEEGGDSNGVIWLLKDHRELIDAEYCINLDGGGGALRNGNRLYMAVQAAEKTSIHFKLEVTNPGGHSSLPVKENAIYRLAAGLERLSHFEFPVHLNDVTRSYLERMSAIENGSQADDLKTILRNPQDAAAGARLSSSGFFNAQLRTTCVATTLAAGHAQNALPQSATANVNCRILPTDSIESIEKKLNEVVADTHIRISKSAGSGVSPISMPDAKLLGVVKRLAEKFWPGTPVVTVMDTGASDGKFLRLAGIPTYGASGMFTDLDDVRAHGRDERTLVKSFNEAREFMYALVAALAK